VISDKDLESLLRLERSQLERQLPSTSRGLVLALVDRLRDATNGESPCVKIVQLVVGRLETEGKLPRLTAYEKLLLSRELGPSVETLWQQCESAITPKHVQESRTFLRRELVALDGQGLNDQVVVERRRGIETGLKALNMLAPEEA
jgi:hypothetical protein